MVTRADLGIGPALVAALSGDGADVRAFATGDGDVGDLQAAGAFVAVGDLDDEGHLDAAMTDVHTVVLPTETWLAEPARLEQEVEVAVAAAESAGVRRIVFVSLVGADAGHRGVRGAFGRAEDTLAAASPQTLVVRTDGVVGAGPGDLAASLDCDPLLAPVEPGRLVDGLVSLDAARSGRDDGHAVFTALGTPRPLSAWLAAGDAAESRTAGTATLVGRRWLAPDRRDDLREALCGRAEPPMGGSDLWSFTEASTT
nr:NAD(P)H-binding protein [Salsipaludibacter albus]